MNLLDGSREPSTGAYSLEPQGVGRDVPDSDGGVGRDVPDSDGGVGRDVPDSDGSVVERIAIGYENLPNAEVGRSSYNSIRVDDAKGNGDACMR